MARVLNRHKANQSEKAKAVYIGRGSKWGNPFMIGKDGNRAEVVAKHREWLLSQPLLVEQAKKELPGKDLLCFCKPLACHGDFLLELANQKGGAKC